jgi:hypothetical protein
VVVAVVVVVVTAMVVVVVVVAAVVMDWWGCMVVESMVVVVVVWADCMVVASLLSTSRPSISSHWKNTTDAAPFAEGGSGARGLAAPPSLTCACAPPGSETTLKTLNRTTTNCGPRMAPL